MIEPLPQAPVITAAGHAIVLNGNGSVLVDGEERPLAPAPATLLRVLASQPGRVFSRAELLRLAWRGTTGDEHVVEVTIGRLRRALGPGAAAVQTVVKRGYRLAVDP
jgi:uroporphyrinogen-III synthase